MESRKGDILTDLGFSASPGTTQRHWIGDEALGEIRLPAILISGAENGPVTLITAGIHGDEYDGLETLLRLGESIDPVSLSGQVLLIPRVNVPAFHDGSRANRFDGLDLDCQFPGRRDGFLTQRLAWFMTERVLPVATLLIDVHGGNAQLDIISYGAVSADTDSAGLLARLITVPHVFDMDTFGLSGHWLGCAAERGIPSVLIEVGGGNRWREGPVTDALHGCRNLLRWQGQLPGDYEALPDKQLLLKGSVIHASTSGFLRPKVSLGDWVKKGQILAELVSLVGEPLETVRSASNAVVNDVRTMPSVRVGEWLYVMGELIEELHYGSRP